ncbi:efflux RND transporter permease subunit [Aliarcobacter skirrowii]|uniref:efflux RND transporter permease subunit n=1 Tax=Aliarcobacter skirrowii TaxID=28200 RepID=UPI0029A5001A|nr:MMPL family transporter [Aliarcobacter skirrowii]MDX4039654.1 MMPL family transporter [Aliarcobacter skirrowii]
MFKKLYDLLIFRYPSIFLILASLFVGFLSYHAKDIQIDASAETLLLEDDEDLRFFRQSYKKYGSSNFLVVTLAPKENLLDNRTLELIKNISKDLEKQDSIKSVDSILTVPLLQSPIRPISDLVAGVDSLSTKEFDKELVKDEFMNSELYKNALVSSDFKTTALLLNLKDDEKYQEFLNKKEQFLKIKETRALNSVELKEEELLNEEFKAYREFVKNKNSEDIEEIRQILKKYENDATVFLGGVNMIASDAIGFIKSDLLIYGLSLIIIFIFVLWYIFRSFRWVFIILFICFISILSTAGILGLFSWEVTVISSNFVALQLIITMSLVVHLVERYKELYFKYKNANQYKLTINTVLSKLIPSFFAIITTVVGFSSLMLSNIEPVINLGLMMSVGILVSLILTFIYFPIFVLLIGKKEEVLKDKKLISFIPKLPNIVLNHGKKIVFVAFFTILFSFIGSSKIFVENSFINYFKENSEIYKGMKVIDENLGGTTPLDVIIKFKSEDLNSKVEDSFDDFEAEFESSKNDAQYWFTQSKMETITKVHDYLESIPEVGKVQSLATLLKIGKLLNNNQDLDGITLAVIYNQLPDEYKKLILSPFVNIEASEARVTMRIIDSNPNLRRDELIKKINSDLEEIITNKETTFRLTNLMVLYNNMLQSLFESQIATATTSIFILAIMFFILFRNIKMVVIALGTNIIPISLVFGIMGWLEIPLDIMTITIAAIALGIAVDDTIHFIHRFDFEYKKSHKDYSLAVEKSLNSVGYPMYHTTIIVVIGFSIFMLSNLVPTIYFGILTAIVMITVLAANLILLPRLLILLKPYKKEKNI